MDDNTQSILLEKYLLTLQADSSAPPPPNLDPELAKMAQRLGAYSRIKARQSAKKRVWETVMTEFEKSSQKPNQKEQSRMLATKTLPSQKSSSLMWVAVATLIFGLAVAVAIVANSRPTPPQFGLGVNQNQTLIPSEAPATQIPTSVIVETIPEGYVPVVTIYVPIRWGDTIREDMLTITYWEASRVPTGAFNRIEDVVGMISTADIPRFLPLTDYMVIDGTLAMTGIPSSGYMPGILTATALAPIATPTPFIDPIASFTFTPTPLLIEATPTVTESFTFTPTPRP